VLSLNDAEIFDVIRSYEKLKASKKKRKDLKMLANTLRLNRFSSKTFKQQS